MKEDDDYDADYREHYCTNCGDVFPMDKTYCARCDGMNRYIRYWKEAHDN